MKQKLTGIPETMLIPLWAKAAETNSKNPIIRDYKAVEIISGIDYDFTKFRKGNLTQVGVSVRTMLFDNAVRNFINRKPNAIIINLGAGLDTRFERFQNDEIRYWYDLDLPEAIQYRHKFFTETDTNRFIAKSVMDESWTNDIDRKDEPVLLIAEGLLMYFDQDEVKSILKLIASKFEGSEMLIELLAPIMVGKSKYHDTVSKIDSKAEFKWGLKDTREIESWHETIKLVDEWSYFDFHKDRWKWFGYIARLPMLRSIMTTRIAHFNLL